MTIREWGSLEKGNPLFIYYLRHEMSIEDARLITAWRESGASWRGTAYLVAIVFEYDCGAYVEETGVVDTIWQVAKEKDDGIWQEHNFGPMILYDMSSPTFLLNAITIAKALGHTEAMQCLRTERQKDIKKLEEKIAKYETELNLWRQGEVENRNVRIQTGLARAKIDLKNILTGEGKNP